GGANKLCFVIAPGKSDILEYYGGVNLDSVTITFVVQPHPSGLCDAIFQAAPLVAANEAVCIGLPDTIWFPENALCTLPQDELSFLLFPVTEPQFFDAVRTNSDGRVLEIQVKQRDAASNWICRDPHARTRAHCRAHPRARRMVSQYRNRGCADRAGAFSRRLSTREMVTIRDCYSCRFAR